MRSRRRQVCGQSPDDQLPAAWAGSSGRDPSWRRWSQPKNAFRAIWTRRLINSNSKSARPIRKLRLAVAPVRTAEPAAARTPFVNSAPAASTFPVTARVIVLAPSARPATSPTPSRVRSTTSAEALATRLGAVPAEARPRPAAHLSRCDHVRLQGPGSDQSRAVLSSHSIWLRRERRCGRRACQRQRFGDESASWAHGGIDGPRRRPRRTRSESTHYSLLVLQCRWLPAPAPGYSCGQGGPRQACLRRHGLV